MWITVSFLYFLRKDELPLLHKAYDIYYEPILQKNALDAVKASHLQFSQHYRLQELRNGASI